MLDFDQFDATARAVTPGVTLGDGIRLVWGAESDMACSVERAVHAGAGTPTLRIRGDDRAKADWFGLEIDVPAAVPTIALTLRNYPTGRLFPRLHVDSGKKVQHIDLPDITASEAFATHHLKPGSWTTEGLENAARLTLLVPSSTWFVMELASVAQRGGFHA